MKKIFGGINLTWIKVLIIAFVIGVYTACSLLIPVTRHTSFSDLGATFEMWIFFGIFIIMNSKSAKDAALKCFVFFLISQPIIYLVQDIVEGSKLFDTYYSTWFKWTILCLPMGYIGYYMKKDKWWGLLILSPMLALLGIQYQYYLHDIMFSFPRHLLTVLFCLTTFISYPLFIFKNKKIKIVGLIISVLIIIIATIITFMNKTVYSTEVLISSDRLQFDNSCKVTMEDTSLGELGIQYIDSLEDYSIHGDFVKEGKTSFILECPNKYKKVYDLSIKINTYDVKEREE